EDDEAEVHLAALDEGEQLAIVRRLDERHVDLRPLRAEIPQQGGEDARADALVRPDPQRAGVAGAERAQVGLGRPQPGSDPLRMSQQELAGLCQRDRTRPAGPVDDALADDALERRDLLADRGLRVAEPRRGTT